MPRPFSLLKLRSLFGLVLLVGSPAAAAPPTVTTLTPHGAERGKAVDLTISGKDLTPQTRLMLPFKAAQELLPDKKPNPAQVRLRLTVDPSVLPGIYPIRLATDHGISPILFFHVDALPAIAEVEDNSTFGKAQKVSVPVVIDGQCPGGDVDYFRFPAKKGQRLVIETISARIGSGVLPQIRATDAKGRFLASDDSQSLHGDCRLQFIAPEDGDYVVEISDSRYRGAAPAHYRLRIADYDFAAEIFPLGGRAGSKVEFVLRGGNLKGEVRVARVLPTVAPGRHIALDLGDALRPGMLPPTIALGDLPEQTYSAGKGMPMDLAVPVTVNGRLGQKGEAHAFRLAVKAGERYRFAVEADALGSALDGLLRVSDQTGKQLAQVDDVDLPPPAPGLQGTKSPDPVLELTVPAGVTGLNVELRDGRHRGGVNFGYRLTVERADQEFALRQPVAEVNLPRGGSVALTVPVLRRGYTGPIQLEVPGLPAGLALQGGYVPAGALQGTLTLGADPAAKMAGPLAVRIEGKALEPGKALRRRADQDLVVARDANVAVATIPLGEFALALTSPPPFTVQGPAAVELVNGYPTTVTVMVTRDKTQKVAAVEVTGLSPLAPPLPGQPQPKQTLTFKPGNAAPEAAQATFLATAGPTLAEGRAGDLLVQGKAKVNNADRLITGPAVQVTVVRPFRVELLTRELTLQPGEKVVLKGRIERRPVFREAVQLKLEGLPKGVTLAAPPAPVAAGATEFQIELRADAKAPPAEGKLTLTATATITGAVYTHPALTVPVRLPAKK
jgi:hypothetical protein